MFRNAFQRLDPRVPTINRRLFFFFFFTRFLFLHTRVDLTSWPAGEMVPSKAVVLLRLGTAEFQYPVFVMIYRKMPMDMHLVSAGFTRQGWLTL